MTTANTTKPRRDSDAVHGLVRVSVTVRIEDAVTMCCKSESRVERVCPWDKDNSGMLLSELAHKAMSMTGQLGNEVAAYCMADYVGKNHRQELVEAARNAELLT